MRDLLKKYFQSFLDKSKEKHGNRYDYSKVVYVNRHTKVEVICPIHGSYFVSPNNHIRGLGCKQCKKEEKEQKKREEILKKIKPLLSMRKLQFCENSFNKNSTSIKVICKKHGHFRIKISKIISGDSCPKCKNEKQYKKFFLKKAKKKYKNKYSYINLPSKSTDKIKIICPIHGAFKKEANSHLMGYGCNECEKERKTKDEQIKRSEFFKKTAQIKFQNKFKYPNLSEFVNYKNVIKITCPIHGDHCNTPDAHLQSKHGCPKCNSNASSFLEDFVKKVLINEGVFFLERDRRTLKNKELDFLLPDLNLAIECNGLYWHSDDFLKKNYHLEKTNKCLDKKIHLIHFFEHDILYKPKAVKSIIKSHIRKTKYKINARDCEVRDINSKISNAFLEKYHLQGRDRSSIRLGLFYKNKLVSVMTFSKNRIALGGTPKDKEFEMNRYCSMYNFNIRGGASKLLTHFERKYKPLKIKTFCDKRISNGQFYLKLNFKKTGESKPNYWYFKKTKVFHRFSFRKSILKQKLEFFDENKTEYQNMKNNGWKRFFDSGNFVFEKKITDRI